MRREVLKQRSENKIQKLEQTIAAICGMDAREPVLAGCRIHPFGADTRKEFEYLDEDGRVEKGMDSAGFEGRA